MLAPVSLCGSMFCGVDKETGQTGWALGPKRGLGVLWNFFVGSKGLTPISIQTRCVVSFEE